MTAYKMDPQQWQQQLRLNRLHNCVVKAQDEDKRAACLDSLECAVNRFEKRWGSTAAAPYKRWISERRRAA